MDNWFKAISPDEIGSVWLKKTGAYVPSEEIVDRAHMHRGRPVLLINKHTQQLHEGIVVETNHYYHVVPAVVKDVALPYSNYYNYSIQKDKIDYYNVVRWIRLHGSSRLKKIHKYFTDSCSWELLYCRERLAKNYGNYHFYVIDDINLMKEKGLYEFLMRDIYYPVVAKGENLIKFFIEMVEKNNLDEFDEMLKNYKYSEDSIEEYALKCAGIYFTDRGWRNIFIGAVGEYLYNLRENAGIHR